MAHTDRTAAAFAEVAPGIHRLESDLGPRFMAQYVLRGDERTLLVDTGLAGTPAEVIRPSIDPSAIDQTASLTTSSTASAPSASSPASSAPIVA